MIDLVKVPDFEPGESLYMAYLESVLRDQKALNEHNNESL